LHQILLAFDIFFQFKTNETVEDLSMDLDFDVLQHLDVLYLVEQQDGQGFRIVGLTLQLALVETNFSGGHLHVAQQEVFELDQWFLLLDLTFEQNL